MRGTYPGEAAGSAGREESLQPAPVYLIQARCRLIQQQQCRTPRPEPRQQHQSPLAIRKCQEPALRERSDAGTPQQGQAVSALQCRQRFERNIGSIQASAHDFHGGIIPAIAFVPILPFRPEVRDLIAGFVGMILPGSRAPGSVGTHDSPDRATHRRPALEQLRLAGAIGSDYQPAFARSDGPAKYRAARHDRSGGGSIHPAGWSMGTGLGRRNFNGIVA